MRVILCLFLLSAVLFFSLFCHYSIQNGILDIESAIHSCAHSISIGAWQEAERYLNSATVIWYQKRSLYAMVARHNLFDEVYVSMQALPVLLSARDESSFSHAVSLCEQLSLLRFSESFSWENVF